MYEEIIHLTKKGGGGTGNDKGWFATELALNTAYPVGQNGWYAVNGETDTVWVWDGDTTAWVDSGIKPSEYWEADGENHIKPKDDKKVKIENIDGFDYAGTQRGQMIITEQVVLNITDTERHKINDSWSDFGLSLDFELNSEEGEIIYTGTGKTVFLVNGTSDLSINQADTIYYGLFINGELKGQTQHTFTNPSKTSNISITLLVELEPNDIIDVRARIETPNKTLTISALDVTFFSGKGEKGDKGEPGTDTNNRTMLATRRTSAPTLYDTQATYSVYEYTYGTTKLYRTVYKTYTAGTDVFYSEASLENVVASRALTF